MHLNFVMQDKIVSSMSVEAALLHGGNVCFCNFMTVIRNVWATYYCRTVGSRKSICQ